MNSPFKKKQQRRRARRLMAPERLEDRVVLTGPFGALPQDTGEFLVGKVVVTPVLMESDGSIDTNQENWTPQLIQEMKDKISSGLDWWVQALAAQNSVHSLEFVVDYTHADNPVATGYEPINRTSNDYVLWTNDFLDAVGFNSPAGSVHDDIRSFNDAQRTALNADWAFTIFVANSDIDSDNQWAAGGSFRRAFAFSGGRMIYMPSGRPDSTVSHETGHMFWGLDEYQFAGTYTDSRGYLEIQNLNAWDNPAPGFVQEPSIMATGALLDQAFANHTSADSTFAMVGWQDTDNNGVFDILDVPHSLDGVGRLNAAGDKYTFAGTASVQTILNRNSKTFGDNRWLSDITTNRITRAEYRLDGGSWMTAASYGAPTANLDLEITLPDQNPHSVDIRTVTIDAGTNMLVTSSPVFSGHTSSIDSVLETGINGIVYFDANENGTLEQGEAGLNDWTVQLVDDFGDPLQTETVVEPDEYSHQMDISQEVSGVTLSRQGSGSIIDTVISATVTGATSTGNAVFGFLRTPTFVSTLWQADANELRMDFDTPVARVAIDTVAELNDSYGRLEYFNSSGQLLGRVTSGLVAAGGFERLEVIRDQADIAFAVAFGHADTVARFDNLEFGVSHQTKTDATGAYSFRGLDPGLYHVQTILKTNFEDTLPNPPQINVNLGAAQQLSGVDFGKKIDAPWHNFNDPVDVDGNGSRSLADLLSVVDAVIRFGLSSPFPDPSDEPPPYPDANANNTMNLSDLLIVVDGLVPPGGGEGETGSGRGNFVGGGGSSSGEGEDSGSGELPLTFQLVASAHRSEILDADALSPDGPQTVRRAAWRETGRTAVSAHSPTDPPNNRNDRPTQSVQRHRRGPLVVSTSSPRSDRARHWWWASRSVADLRADAPLEEVVAEIAMDVDSVWQDGLGTEEPAPVHAPNQSGDAP
ncbi:MAG: carboxypeptidase-like regulatory domain-containing protein [Pirellulaceae bacterium]|jgi:hypothetical protein|nr:carboxypeptidase-like regulatory domain-containing protein [Pirellulaceae bacterium]